MLFTACYLSLQVTCNSGAYFDVRIHLLRTLYKDLSGMQSTKKVVCPKVSSFLMKLLTRGICQNSTEAWMRHWKRKILSFSLISITTQITSYRREVVVVSGGALVEMIGKMPQNRQEIESRALWPRHEDAMLTNYSWEADGHDIENFSWFCLPVLALLFLDYSMILRMAQLGEILIVETLNNF